MPASEPSGVFCVHVQVQAVKAADPGGTRGAAAMRAQTYPAVEVVAEMRPNTMWELSPGVYIFDLAQARMQQQRW
jgi:hypothetical protein